MSESSIHPFTHDVDPVEVPLILATGSTSALNAPAVRPPEETETAASIDVDSWRDDVRRESLSTPPVKSECIPNTQEDENVGPDILENVVHELQ